MVEEIDEEKKRQTEFGKEPILEVSGAKISFEENVPGGSGQREKVCRLNDSRPKKRESQRGC